MKKIMMLALALSLAVILAACGNDDSADDKKKDDKEKTEETAGQEPAQDMEITDEEKVKEDDVVVKINGQDVKGAEYNALYPQIKMQASGMGQEVDQDQLKEFTIDSLVGQTLLKQEVEDKGVEVPDKDVDAEIEEMKSQGEDQYEAMMEQNNLESEEELRDELVFALQFEKYAEEEFDIKVTDDEVEELYDQVKEQGEGEDVPELKDIKDQIEAQITQDKTQEATQAKVEELKEKAEIKTMI